MTKRVTVILILMTFLAQAGQEVKSFCGFQLGEPISKVFGEKPALSRDFGSSSAPGTLTLLDKPFRGFRHAKLDWSREGNLLLAVTVERFLSVTNEDYVAVLRPEHPQGNARHAQKSSAVVTYTKDELNREVDTLVKMVVKKFGEPLRKSYEGNISFEKADKLRASRAGISSNANHEVRQRNEAMRNSTAGMRRGSPRMSMSAKDYCEFTRKIFLHYPDVTITAGYTEANNFFERQSRGAVLRAKLMISCESVKGRSDDLENRNDHELERKKRVGEFSQEEVDSL